MQSSLAVLEGKWWLGSNVSVRGLFDLICHLQYGSADGYHYEMFCDGAALDNIARRVAANPVLRCVYVAAHGSESAIYGSDETPITRAKVRNCFTGFDANALHGLYFGACTFADMANATFLLAGDGPYGKGSFVWVAGFDTEVPWVESSAFDFIFWNAYINDQAGGGPSAKVKRTASYLRKTVGALADQLGFHVWVRKRGGAGATTICDLMVE